MRVRAVVVLGSLVAVVALVACGRTVPVGEPVGRSTKPPPPPPDLSAAPPGSTGKCRVAPKADAGVRGGESRESRESPEVLAGCPDPMEWVRGDGIETSAGLPKVSPSVMPPWDLEQMRDFACAYACAPIGSAAHLLAWSVIEDDRPLRNHNAVFAVEHALPAPRTRWSLVVMYRHATNTWWNLDVSFHRPSRPVRHGKSAPTARIIDAMLDENRWQFEPEHMGFKVLAGNVIDPVWQAVTGEAPKRFFPEGIER